MKYEKPPLAIEKHIDLLKSRGLTITNLEKARHYLMQIGYYRLSAYFIPFNDQNAPTEEHKFSQGTDFQDILDLYMFDRELRLILLDGLREIEIAVKNIYLTLFV